MNGWIVYLQSGTDIVIFAYGLQDPDMSSPVGIISYHENRRGTRIVPLRSYAVPPPEDEFADLDYINFQLSNVSDFVTNEKTIFRSTLKSFAVYCTCQ